MAAIPVSLKRCSVAVLISGVILLAGCMRMVESWALNRSDAAIRRAGDAIASAKSDSQRATAYADQADAYIDKARYARLQKLISLDEYARLFDLALADYKQAMALKP